MLWAIFSRPCNERSWEWDTYFSTLLVVLDAGHVIYRRGTAVKRYRLQCLPTQNSRLYLITWAKISFFPPYWFHVLSDLPIAVFIHGFSFYLPDLRTNIPMHSHLQICTHLHCIFIRRAFCFSYEGMRLMGNLATHLSAYFLVCHMRFIQQCLYLLKRSIVNLHAEEGETFCSSKTSKIYSK